MSLQTLVAVAALLVAVIAYVIARRNARQLKQLSEMYWQLKYAHGELKSQVSPPSEEPTAPPKQTFVPLSTLKRS